MTWDAHADEIQLFSVLENVSWTKRGVLRQLTRIFDPMSLLAAFLVRGKILMKELWISGRDWDDPLEPDVKGSWSTWFNQFADLASIVIPRLGRRKHRTASICGRITTCYEKCQMSNVKCQMSAE